jgi:electron transfer flavoprotein beta subunit
MNILVLIAGVADPKWPLPAVADTAALQAHGDRYALLSPFDEAALELALKLRDDDAGVAIHALVAGPESLARKVAEWRLESVQRLTVEVAAWDARACAGALAGAAAALPAEPALVLTGREFGDFDDGGVPPLLARALRLPHVGLALNLAVREDGTVWATRQRGGRVERVRLEGRALVSVTNDAQNRLRHPLLKNVMAARKLLIEALAAVAPASTVGLEGLQPAAPARRGSGCRMLTGALAEQADALAQVLLQEGVPA